MNRSTINKIRESKIRQFFWPIRSREFIKFFPMVGLLFLLMLSQNLLRIIKDSLVMTRVGPETISFIKLWIEMPLGFLFVLIYAKLCNKFTTEKVFQIIVLFFSTLFITFGFFIFPNYEALHPSEALIAEYILNFPNFKWFFTIYGKWSFVLFYASVEMWPIIAITLLFWQLANKIIKLGEAVRFYPFFGVFSHAGLLFCGVIVPYFSDPNNAITKLFGSNSNSKTETLIKCIIFVVGIICSFILVLHKFIESKIVKNSEIVNQENNIPLKLNLKDSIKSIVKSKYLWLITLLALSYSMSINLMEGIWMSNIRDLYPRTEEFAYHYGNVLFFTGCFAILCDIICNYTIRRFGWFFSAVLTPVVTMISGSMFYVMVLSKDHLSGFTNFSPIYAIVYAGAFWHIVSKGVKYSLFDDTKEMLYIPLNNEMKTKGKAAVDVMGAKFGKSSGSILQFVIFSIFPSVKYNDIAQYLLIFFVIICSIWIIAVKNLDKDYKKLREKYEH